MNEINRLSSSGIKQFRNCEKAFWYKYISNVEPPDEKEPDFFAVGNAVHDSLENVLQEEGVLGLSESELLERLREEERSLDYNYNASEKVQNCLETASRFVHGYVEDVVSVEDEWNMNVKGVDFKGYSDLVADITEDGEEYRDVIIDWKTGKENEEWKERIQGGMYVRMFYEEYGRWPDSIQFVYLNESSRSIHNRISDGEIVWNDHQNKYWDEIESDVSKISNAMFNNRWEAKPESSQCHFCSFKYACSDYIGAEEVQPKNFEMGDVL